MADLMPCSDSRNGERGQLLLVAAFIIAVSFVVLALVVNSAIFTENLATRDDVAGSGEVMEYRHEFTQSAGEVITEFNQNNSLDRSELDASVENISTQGAIQQSTQGRSVKFEPVLNKSGIKFAQDDPNSDDPPNFQNFSRNAKDWTVVENVEKTRNFNLNITRWDTLASTNPFQIIVSPGPSSPTKWTLTIAKSGTMSDKKVEIAVETPSVSSETCTRDFRGHLRIDVTRGVAGGDPCHALIRLTDGTPMWFGTGVSSGYQIEFNQGERINGTYSFIVNDGASVVNPDNLGSPGDGPYKKDAIYSATVDYSYYTADVGFESEIRIAPGEVPP